MPAARAGTASGHAGPPTRVYLCPVFLLRIPGLPVDAPAALQMPVHWSRMQALLEQEEALREPAGQLVAALHRLIPTFAAAGPGTAERKTARSLLELKRAIHQGRPPKDPARYRAALPHLGSADRARLEAWRARLASLLDAERETAAAYEQELVLTRAALRTWLRHTEMRKGLQAASPAFERSLDRYLDDSRSLDHRARVSEDRAVHYLYRASCKTSPFSRLGVVAPGRWTASGTTALPILVGSERRSRVRVNVAMVAPVLERIADAAVARGAGAVVLNSASSLSDGQVHFLRRLIRDREEVGGIAGLVTLVPAQLPLTPHLTALLQVLHEGRPHTLDDLASALAQRGLGALPELRRYLELLFRRSLLISPHARVPAGAPDPIEAALEPHRRDPAFQPQVAAIERLAQLARAIEQGDLPERRRALAEIETQLPLLTPSPARDPATSGAPGTSGGVAPPRRTAVYEDCTAAGEPLSLSVNSYQSRLETLALLHRVSLLLDSSLPLRVALKQHFLRQFGAGGSSGDLARFAQAFARECAEPYWEALARSPRRGRLPLDEALLEPGQEVESLRRLRALRRRLAGTLRARAAEASRSAGAGAEVHFTGAELEALAGMVPTPCTPLLSTCFYVQESADRRWVLNRAYGGLTRMMSRFLHLWPPGPESVREALTAYLESMEPEVGLFAEIQGSYDTNLNLHPPVTRCEITLPGERSSRSEDRCIPVTDLFLVHDVASDQLHVRSRRLGRRVTPIYLGALGVDFLPPLHRLLAYLSPTSNTRWPDRELFTPAGPEGGSWPRIAVDDVVLLRATWAESGTSLPARDGGERPAAYHLRLARHLRRRGIPAVSFVQMEGGSAGARGRLPGVGRPMVLDLRSGLSVNAFEKELARSYQRVWFTEALPAHAQTVVESGGRSFVSEQAIEISTRFGAAHAVELVQHPHLPER